MSRLSPQRVVALLAVLCASPVSAQISPEKQKQDKQVVYVLGFRPGSEAEKAGVERGDVLVSFAGEPIRTLDDLRRIKDKLKAGKGEASKVYPLVLRRDEAVSVNLSTGFWGMETGLGPASGIASGIRLFEHHKRGEQHFRRRALRDALKEWKAAHALAEKAGDRSKEAHLDYDVAKAHAALGEHAQALKHLDRSLKLYEQLGDRKLQAIMIKTMGVEHKELAAYAEAIKSYERALEIFVELGDRNGEAGVLMAMATMQWKREKNAEALEYYERLLTVLRELGDRRREGWVLRHMGSIFERRAEYDQGLKLYERALERFVEFGDRRRESWVLQNMGNLQKARAKFDEALKHYDRALRVFVELGDRSGEAVIITNIGMIHWERGEYDEALKFYERSRKVYVKIGDRSGEAKVLMNIGVVTKRRGKPDEGLKFFEQALNIYVELGDRKNQAWGLSNIGAVHSNREDFVKALKFFERARELYLEAGDRGGEAKVLHQIGVVHAKRAEYGEAMKLFERAQKTFVELRDRRGEAKVLTGMGNVHKARGQHSRALRLHQHSLRMFEDIGFREGELTGLLNIGSFLWARDEFVAALKLYERLLELNQKLDDPKGQVLTLMNLGDAHLRLGQYLRALGCDENALRLSRELKDRSAEARCLSNLVSAYSNLGEYTRALEISRQALNMFVELRDRHGEATVLLNRATIQSDLGRTREALKLRERSLKLFTELGDRKHEALTLAGIGALLGDLDESEKALEYLERARKIHRELGNRLYEAVDVLNIASVHHRRDEKAAALKYLELGLKVKNDLGIPDAQFALNRSRWLLPGRDESEALARRDLAVALMAPAVDELREEMRRGGPRATVQRHLAAFEEAVDTAWGGAEDGKGHARTVSVNEDWTDVPEATRKASETSRFLGWSYAEVGFHIVESLRAQGFALEMAARTRDVEAGVDPELIKARNGVAKRLNTLRARHLALRSAEPDLAALRKGIAGAAGELERAQRAIALASPALAALQVREPVRLAKLRETLAEDEMFLLYVLTGQKGCRHLIDGELVEVVEAEPSGRTYLLAATREEVRVFTVGTTSDLTDRSEIFRKTLRVQAWSDATASYTGQARVLFEDLIGPALKALDPEGTKVRHLVISPDGALTRLPFDALLTGDPADGAGFAGLRYLAQRFSTEITASATAWVDGRGGSFRRGEPGKVFVAFADPDYGKGIDADRLRKAWVLEPNLPGQAAALKAAREEHRSRRLAKLSPDVRKALEKHAPDGLRGGDRLGALPGTRKEVAAVTRLIESSGSHTRVFLGRAARELNIRREDLLRDAGTLHFACHAVADDLRPTDASLILTTEGLPEGEDGFLTAAEVVGLRTNARLVVLSACETGLGRLSRGEGMQGLTRAWRFAGARTVVTSLWKVDDEATAEFMEAFYEAMLKDKKMVTAALATARRKLAGSKKFAAPWYWAAFTAQGER